MLHFIIRPVDLVVSNSRVEGHDLLDVFDDATQVGVTFLGAVNSINNRDIVVLNSCREIREHAEEFGTFQASSSFSRFGVGAVHQAVPSSSDDDTVVISNDSAPRSRVVGDGEARIHINFNHTLDWGAPTRGGSGRSWTLPRKGI